MDSATDSFSLWNSKLNLIDFNKAEWDKYYQDKDNKEEIISDFTALYKNFKDTFSQPIELYL